MAAVHRADVVVIGSGGLGASTAFHLVARGARDVVVVDKHELASQTSPRAAGLMSHARTSDFMIELVQLATANLKRFAAETGEPLDWAQSGSLKVVRREEDVEVIDGDVLRGQRHGLDIERVSLDEAHRLNPLLQTEGITAVMRVGDDVYFDPAQVAIGYVRGAEARGATMLPHTTVTRVNIEDERVVGVETDQGTIRTRVVVDAAGAWTRQVAAASGITIPLVPTRHQLFVTEPIEGVHAELPIVRIADAAVYVRPCEGGLLWGGYEEAPRMFDMDALGGRFSIPDTPLDADVLWRMADDVRLQLPVLREAAVREHRGGLPTMTADGDHIVGPAPRAEGFFIAGGCNVAGLSVSPAIGDALAAWIVEGEPPLDLGRLSVTRFASGVDELERKAAWQYRHFYGVA
ncbi:MAG TPA: FAD-binding oxidoreductase [Gaiellaceae bacterium]|jgi:4-methylaminobutanoate oxidase (formaldehyde-forming)|nr:FAD-binding oxidoreductase [Gaiellaceae bacterium]